MNLELELFLELLTEIIRLEPKVKLKIGKLIEKSGKRTADFTLGELALLSDIVQGKNDALKNKIYRESADC
jgi:hypothetical protein